VADAQRPRGPRAFNRQPTKRCRFISLSPKGGAASAMPSIVAFMNSPNRKPDAQLKVAEIEWLYRLHVSFLSIRLWR